MLNRETNTQKKEREIDSGSKDQFTWFTLNKACVPSVRVIVLKHDQPLVPYSEEVCNLTLRVSNGCSMILQERETDRNIVKITQKEKNLRKNLNNIRHNISLLRLLGAKARGKACYNIRINIHLEQRSRSKK